MFDAFSLLGVKSTEFEGSKSPAVEWIGLRRSPIEYKHRGIPIDGTPRRGSGRVDGRMYKASLTREAKSA
jgi:hypothetical protein